MYGTYIMQRCFHSFANNGLILKRIYKNACVSYLQIVDKFDGVCVVFQGMFEKLVDLNLGIVLRRFNASVC